MERHQWTRNQVGMRSPLLLLTIAEILSLTAWAAGEALSTSEIWSSSMAASWTKSPSREDCAMHGKPGSAAEVAWAAHGAHACMHEKPDRPLRTHARQLTSPATVCSAARHTRAAFLSDASGSLPALKFL